MMLRYHGFPFWDMNEAVAMIPGPVASPTNGADIFDARDINHFLSSTKKFSFSSLFLYFSLALDAISEATLSCRHCCGGIRYQWYSKVQLRSTDLIILYTVRAEIDSK